MSDIHSHSELVFMLKACYEELNTCSTLLSGDLSPQERMFTRVALARAMGLVQMVRRDYIEGVDSPEDVPF